MGLAGQHRDFGAEPCIGRGGGGLGGAGGGARAGLLPSEVLRIAEVV